MIKNVINISVGSETLKLERVIISGIISVNGCVNSHRDNTTKVLTCF